MGSEMCIRDRPVVDEEENLVGIITNRDIRFVSDDSILVSEMMTTDLVTVPEHVDPEVAKKLLHQHRIEKLLVVDEDGKCAGMMTVRDIQRSRDIHIPAKISTVVFESLLQPEQERKVSRGHWLCSRLVLML